MSCVFCEYYKELKTECRKGRFVENLSESFDCEYYDYNGRLTINEEK